MSYSWDKFLKPLSSTDTNLQIMDDNGVVTHTINPYVILNVLINNNLLKISLRSSKVIIIPFSTINESKLALPLIKESIDTLNSKTPLFMSSDIKNYVDSVTDEFFYQDTTPIGTGTDVIKTGTFWYDTEFGFLYVYINDDLSGYNWITAVGEVGPIGPIGATGPAGATGPTGPSIFEELIAKENVTNPNNFILFHYDAFAYSGANFNFVEVNNISGDSTTYHVIVANNSNLNVKSDEFYITTAATTSTIISATISGSEIRLVSNGTGTYTYRGHSQLF